MTKQEALDLLEEVWYALEFVQTHHTDPTQDKEVELALEDAFDMLTQLFKFVEACGG